MFLLVFWFVFLFVLPIAISMIEIRLGIQRFPPQPAIAMALLAAGSILSIWSALAMALVGHGTPAVFDTARRLVAAGPYRYLRHPFALATFVQSVAIGLALGSAPVLAYALAMFLVWYAVVRPREEQDLEARFGHDWRRYAAAVRSLVPRMRPYRSGA